MKNKATLYRVWILALAAVFAIGIGALPMLPASAQAHTTTHATRKKTFAQRHPTLTSAAAGVAAYKIAKKSGNNRAAAGGKKNFAQRHPVLTGVAAAGVTHHIIKKSIKKHH